MALRDLIWGTGAFIIWLQFYPQQIFVSELGEMAWDSGGYVNTLKGPDGPVKEEGKYLGVYHKVDGVWKAAAFCITPNG